MTNAPKGYIRLFVVAATCWLAYSVYVFITESRSQDAQHSRERAEAVEVMYRVPVYVRDEQGQLTRVVSRFLGMYYEVNVLQDAADCFPRTMTGPDQLALYETMGPLLQREERLIVLHPAFRDLVTQGLLWQSSDILAPEFECARKADHAFEARYVEARREAGARTVKSSLLQAIGGVLAIALLLWVVQWLIAGFSTERR